jgi:hypothetical protein
MLVSGALVAAPVAGAPPRQGQAAIVLSPVVSGLSQPLFVTHAGDGSGRLFVLERDGLIRVVVGGQLRATPFLDFDGTPSRSTTVGPAETSVHDNTVGRSTCYVLAAMAGSSALGSTDALCGVPGIATVGTSAIRADVR